MAFYKYVVVTAMLPAMIHPSGVRMRRRYPYARHPDVRVPIPAMIATLINIPGMRRRPANLNYRARRRDLHDDLFAHRADCQQTAGDRSEN